MKMNIITILQHTAFTGNNSQKQKTVTPTRANIKFGGCRGFTLIETLIAIVIFATLVITVLFSYNSMFMSSRAINDGTGIYEMARTCICRMVLDLESILISGPPAYSPPIDDKPPDPNRLIGDETTVGGNSFSRLRFASSAHLPMESDLMGGVGEIVYYVQAGVFDKFVLRRSDSLSPSYEEFEEKESDPILCENVKSLTFEYYDEEEDAFDYWDSESTEFGNATPRSIKIRLGLGRGDEERIFETRVTLPVYREAKGQ